MSVFSILRAGRPRQALNVQFPTCRSKGILYTRQECVLMTCILGRSVCL